MRIGGDDVKYTGDGTRVNTTTGTAATALTILKGQAGLEERKSERRVIYYWWLSIEG